MASNSLGTLFRITTWGESHGPAIGVVIDGCPSMIPLCEDDIQSYLDKRKPGQSRFMSMRKEGDKVKILSGVFDGKTTGTPISLLIEKYRCAFKRLRRGKGKIPPGSRRLCLLCQIRHPGLSRRRTRFRARNRVSRCGRSRRPQNPWRNNLNPRRRHPVRRA